ncbi:hypothetical protein CYY_001092 [Polysphondylium violaceum]|uniref:Nucleoside phosphorylase domain-containing protein n=1 Tax=Polysphondylium violaceum TaxID=133409 RepID=A0A8J4Q2H0_9MYCE|nr:hypothetical protein CYY_001092 [Polysphondylium violaceum]
MVNVCLITSLIEDAADAKSVFEEDGFTFDQVDESAKQFSFWEGKKDSISLFLVYAQGQGNNGTIQIADQIFDYLLKARKIGVIDMAFMTGVISGKSGSTHLGDILVSSSTFDCTEGINENDGNFVAPNQYGPRPSFLNLIQMQMYDAKDYYLKKFPGQNETYARKWVQRLHYELFSSDATKEDSDWLKDQGITNFKQIFKNKSIEEKNIPYKLIVKNLLESKDLEYRGNDLYVSDNLKTEIERELTLDEYPSESDSEPIPPQVFFKPWVCVPTQGNKAATFKFINEKIEASAIGIDMESAAFYRTASLANIASLCVKGVVDYGEAEDSDKNMVSYGRKISASYVLSIIKKNIGFSDKKTTSTENYWVICPDEYSQQVKNVYQENGVAFGAIKSIGNNSFAYIEGEYDLIKGKKIKVYLSFVKGNMDTLLHANSGFKEFQPSLTIMVGTCSGNRTSDTPPNTYDLIVATRSFNYTTGINTNDGFNPNNVQYYDPIHSLVDNMKLSLKGIPFDLPKDNALYQQEWLLKVIVEFEKENSTWLKEQGFDTSKSLFENKNPRVQKCFRERIDQGLINSSSPKAYREANGNLKPTDAGKTLANTWDEVYDKTSGNSKVIYGRYASGTAIERRDSQKAVSSTATISVSKIYELIKGRDCQVIGIDQESSSFYQAAIPNNRNALTMKTVTDFADSENPTSETVKVGNIIAAKHSFNAFLAFFDPQAQDSM